MNTLKIKQHLFLILLFSILAAAQLCAEDGSRLWLRFSDVQVEKNLFSEIIANEKSLPVKEFRSAWKEMNGGELKTQTTADDKALIIGTVHDGWIKELKINFEWKELGKEGYLIRTLSLKKGTTTVIAANTDAGLLYGVYHLIRLLQTQRFTSALNIVQKPAYDFRILNHWDNPDGTVERGYAGRSIWKWEELPEQISPRYEQYARANASIGINAVVLNNVNASPKMLTGEYLKKVQTIASVLRPFHIRVFLSINFASPKEIGGLINSDPLNTNVRKWWAEKAKEIYTLIPDFGGFLVKANSEGLPGPMDYGRTHVDGANMLADALKPFGGIVMWRAFVYEPGDDRVKLAYKEFYKFDGLFRDNVIIQVKNGPVDFQPREPFSPLFGAMRKTALMPELQITQEYLGQGNHLVFLSTMWQEFLATDTYCSGKGSTIARVTTGQIYPQKFTAIAGVANIGEDANWCGHHFAQANWYAFGRLAWDNGLSSAQIADEWTRMTFNKQLSADPRWQKNWFGTYDSQDSCLNAIKQMMLTSHQTAVDYMMPLGLHHIFAWDHHYGPEPWCDVPGARADWLPRYYHRADSVGLGCNRTTTGSNAVSQYCAPLKDEFNSPENCPEQFLLWFHHVPWNYRMKDGKTLWDELCYKYDNGVKQVREYQKIWDKAEPFIDVQRFREVQSKLRTQARDAVWWKDACLLYFQTFSNLPIPYDIERPVHDLDDLKKIRLDMKHHN
jgi:alpha-glucuronidase